MKLKMWACVNPQGTMLSYTLHLGRKKSISICLARQYYKYNWYQLKYKGFTTEQVEVTVTKIK